MSTVTASDTTAEPVAPEFDEIFREYHPLIYRTAYGVTGSVQDAEDIVQTVLFRILRREISLDAVLRLSIERVRGLLRWRLNSVFDCRRRRQFPRRGW